MFFYTFNGAASNPFSLTGPANCSIFGLHIHTHSYARLHTLTPSVTHTLTHSLTGGGGTERQSYQLGLQQTSLCERRGDDSTGSARERTEPWQHGEPRASLPVIAYSKSVHLIYQHKTVFGICLRSGKNGWDLKDAGGTECDVYLKTFVNIYCDKCINYYVNLSAVYRTRCSRCAVCHLD